MSRSPPTPKPDGKREQNRQARLQAIEQAALPLFLARGVDGVTVDEIVARAGMAKGSFYRYHADQAALVAWLVAPLADAVRTAFAEADQALRKAKGPAELAQAYQALAGGLAQGVLVYPDRVRLYLQESRGPAVGARRPVAALAQDIARGALALTVAAQARKLLRPMDPRISSLAVVGAVERMLHATLSGEDVGNPLAAAEALISLVLDGIRAPKRR